MSMLEIPAPQNERIYPGLQIYYLTKNLGKWLNILKKKLTVSVNHMTYDFRIWDFINSRFGT